MTDYKTLAEELRLLRHPYSYSPTLGDRAADAIEALVAENKRITKNREDWASRMMEFASMEQRALAAEARIEKVRANWSRRYSDTGNLLPDATEAITAALAAAPSGLVEDMRRNTAAQAWDEGRSAWASFEMRCEDAASAGQGVMIGLPVNPYRQETR